MADLKNRQPNPIWLANLEAIQEILGADGCSLSQGALGWLLARSDKTIPIPGFRTVKQVEENARTLALGALSQAQMQQIAELLNVV